VEPTQREVDRDLDSSMKMFERVKLGEVAPIHPRTPQRMLLALDGSSQDATSIDITVALVERYPCQVSIVAACDDAQRVANGAKDRLSGSTIVAAVGPKDPFEPILAAAESEKSDLVIAPCPFGRDFEKIGPDSAGTVVDVLLARLTVPILIVREPHDVAKPVFHNIALRSIGENEAAHQAAVWAVTLAASGGSLELILVFEEEMRENLGMLLKSLDLDVEPSDENLMAALRKAHVRLHRALQKSGEQLDFNYTLTVVNPPDSAPFPEKSFSALSLVVVALERSDHMSQGYARDCVLHRRQPVLVVPRN
jgi:hypothetical protein